MEERNKMIEEKESLLKISYLEKKSHYPLGTMNYSYVIVMAND